MSKLTIIQSKLHAPKSQYNSFGKYNYRNCEDILEALKPLLLEENCTLHITDSIEVYADRIYIVATATFDDGEKSISSKGYARESESKKGMDDSQITGSTSSYARKYALNGLFCIDDTKDSDSQKQNTKEETKKEPKANNNCVCCGKELSAKALETCKANKIPNICSQSCLDELRSKQNEKQA